MTNKPHKPQLDVAISEGSFYWVRPLHDKEFEPAKCKDYYRNGKLYFCFISGSIMEIDCVWEVKPLIFSN